MSKLQKTKAGLVFSGGGGKGAYEIGVWKALKEFDIVESIEAVAGTSIGGLNAALFVKGDLDSAIKMWHNISRSQVMKNNFTLEGLANELNPLNKSKLENIAQPLLLTPQGRALRTVVMGIPKFTQKGIIELINKSKSCEAVSSSEIPMYVCALNGNSMKLEIPKLNGLTVDEVNLWLQATSAIPFVFGSVSINNEKYHDGGVLPFYSNNTPYQPLIEIENCTHIINVYLERSPIIRAEQAKYSNVKFWNIIPSKEFDGLIAPLNFDANNAKKLINLGYEDTKNILEKFKNFQNTENRYLDNVCNFAQQNTQFKEGVKLNQSIRNNDFSEINAFSNEAMRLVDESSELNHIAVNNDNVQKEDFSTSNQSVTFDEVSKKIEEEITFSERAIINESLDNMIKEMGENSVQLLDEAFTAITTISSTDGQINDQLEQGFLGRILGDITGKNSKLQADVNKGLNQSIHATITLIQKLQHKNMLTMEAVTSLSNKTNYLMSNVNLLHLKLQQLEQKQHKALKLMQSALQSFSIQVQERFVKIESRLDDLERRKHIDDWYHQTKNIFNESNPSNKVLGLTSTFYQVTKGDWTKGEMHRFMNALNDLKLNKIELSPFSLIENEYKEEFFSQIEQRKILPLAPKNKACFPILAAMQEANENKQLSSEDSINKIRLKSNLDISIKLPAKNIALELLHGMKSNDRTVISVHTNLSAKQVQYKQALLTVIEEAESLKLSGTLIKNSQQIIDVIENFTVIVPVIGAFSSGKSSLLNYYLGKEYLKHGITPETAIATELTYSKDEKIVLHYIENPPTTLSISELNNIVITDDLFYVQAFINNVKLKYRSNLTLVDMPGFNSESNAHNKAIAKYINRGDHFISLIPIDSSIDHSLLTKLHEISSIYKKDFDVFLSKSFKRPMSQQKEQKDNVEEMIRNNLGINKTVNTLEVKGADSNIIEFENQLDELCNQDDKYIELRYLESIQQTVTSAISEVTRIKKSLTSNQSEFEQKQQKQERESDKLYIELQEMLAQLKHNLTITGVENLSSKALNQLNNATGQLIAAAKANNIPHTLTEILRPTVQKEVDLLVDFEIQKLELDLTVTPHSIELLGITLDIPPIEKEQFNKVGAAIGAGLGLISGGLLSITLAGIGSQIGKSDNTQDVENLIKNKINSTVIPQALEAIKGQLIKVLTVQCEKLEEALMTSFSEKQQAYINKIKVIKQQMKDHEETHNVQNKRLSQAEKLLLELKSSLTSDLISTAQSNKN